MGHPVVSELGLRPEALYRAENGNRIIRGSTQGLQEALIQIMDCGRGFAGNWLCQGKGSPGKPQENSILFSKLRLAAFPSLIFLLFAPAP